MNIWQNGIGATGSLFGATKGLSTTGSVWFVDSAAATHGDGTNELAPLATLVAAISAASSGDIISLASTHAETIASLVSFSSRLYIVGCGQSSGEPMATLTLGVAAGGVALSLASAGASGCVFSNIKFVANGRSSAAIQVTSSAKGVIFDACVFESTGAYLASGGSPGVALDLATGSEGNILQRCVFRSTAPSAATAANAAGLGMTTTTRTRLWECVFDAGSYGWATAYGCYSSSTHTDLLIKDLSLLRGADVLIGSSSTGNYNLSSASTGKGRVSW